MIINESDILSQAQSLEAELTKIKHITDSTDIMTWFADDFALRFCWSSNAIEGNTLTLDETVALIEYDEVRSGHTYSEYQDAKNLYRAIKEMLFPFAASDISADWVKKGNSLITGNTGEYRKVPVKIGNLIETVYIPPSAEKVPELMKNFFENVNFKAENIFELVCKIAKTHLDFERIHPFFDGNGRTGRLILNKQLINHSLLPITLNKTGAYRRSFKIYERNGDMSLLIHEILSEEEAAICRLREFYRKKNSDFVS